MPSPSSLPPTGASLSASVAAAAKDAPSQRITAKPKPLVTARKREAAAAALPSNASAVAIEALALLEAVISEGDGNEIASSLFPMGRDGSIVTPSVTARATSSTVAAGGGAAGHELPRRSPTFFTAAAKASASPTPTTSPQKALQAALNAAQQQKKTAAVGKNNGSGGPDGTSNTLGNGSGATAASAAVAGANPSTLASLANPNFLSILDVGRLREEEDAVRAEDERRRAALEEADRLVKMRRERLRRSNPTQYNKLYGIGNAASTTTALGGGGGKDGSVPAPTAALPYDAEAARRARRKVEGNPLVLTEPSVGDADDAIDIGTGGDDKDGAEGGVGAGGADVASSAAMASDHDAFVRRCVVFEGAVEAGRALMSRTEGLIVQHQRRAAEKKAARLRALAKISQPYAATSTTAVSGGSAAPSAQSSLQQQQQQQGRKESVPSPSDERPSAVVIDADEKINSSKPRSSIVDASSSQRRRSSAVASVGSGIGVSPAPGAAAPSSSLAGSVFAAVIYGATTMDRIATPPTTSAAAAEAVVSAEGSAAVINTPLALAPAPASGPSTSRSSGPLPLSSTAASKPLSDTYAATAAAAKSSGGGGDAADDSARFDGLERALRSDDEAADGGGGGGDDDDEDFAYSAWLDYMRTNGRYTAADAAADEAAEALIARREAHEAVLLLQRGVMPVGMGGPQQQQQPQQRSIEYPRAVVPFSRAIHGAGSVLTYTHNANSNTNHNTSVDGEGGKGGGSITALGGRTSLSLLSTTPANAAAITLTGGGGPSSSPIATAHDTVHYDALTTALLSRHRRQADQNALIGRAMVRDTSNYAAIMVALRGEAEAMVRRGAMGAATREAKKERRRRERRERKEAEARERRLLKYSMLPLPRGGDDNAKGESSSESYSSDFDSSDATDGEDEDVDDEDVASDVYHASDLDSSSEDDDGDDGSDSESDDGDEDDAIGAEDGGVRRKRRRKKNAAGDANGDANAPENGEDDEEEEEVDEDAAARRRARRERRKRRNKRLSTWRIGGVAMTVGGAEDAKLRALQETTRRRMRNEIAKRNAHTNKLTVETWTQTLPPQALSAPIKEDVVTRRRRLRREAAARVTSLESACRSLSVEVEVAKANAASMPAHQRRAAAAAVAPMEERLARLMADRDAAIEQQKRQRNAWHRGGGGVATAAAANSGGSPPPFVLSSSEVDGPQKQPQEDPFPPTAASVRRDTEAAVATFLASTPAPKLNAKQTSASDALGLTTALPITSWRGMVTADTESQRATLSQVLASIGPPPPLPAEGGGGADAIDSSSQQQQQHHHSQFPSVAAIEALSLEEQLLYYKHRCAEHRAHEAIMRARVSEVEGYLSNTHKRLALLSTAATGAAHVAEAEVSRLIGLTAKAMSQNERLWKRIENVVFAARAAVRGAKGGGPLGGAMGGSTKESEEEMLLSAYGSSFTRRLQRWRRRVTALEAMVRDREAACMTLQDDYQTLERAYVLLFVGAGGMGAEAAMGGNGGGGSAAEAVRRMGLDASFFAKPPLHDAVSRQLRLLNDGLLPQRGGGPDSSGAALAITTNTDNDNGNDGVLSEQQRLNRLPAAGGEQFSMFQVLMRLPTGFSAVPSEGCGNLIVAPSTSSVEARRRRRIADGVDSDEEEEEEPNSGSDGEEDDGENDDTANDDNAHSRGSKKLQLPYSREGVREAFIGLAKGQFFAADAAASALMASVATSFEAFHCRDYAGAAKGLAAFRDGLRTAVRTTVSTALTEAASFANAEIVRKVSCDWETQLRHQRRFFIREIGKMAEAGAAGADSAADVRRRMKEEQMERRREAARAAAVALHRENRDRAEAEAGRAAQIRRFNALTQQVFFDLNKKLCLTMRPSLLVPAYTTNAIATAAALPAAVSLPPFPSSAPFPQSPQANALGSKDEAGGIVGAANGAVLFSQTSSSLSLGAQSVASAALFPLVSPATSPSAASLSPMHQSRGGGGGGGAAPLLTLSSQSSYLFGGGGGDACNAGDVLALSVHTDVVANSGGSRGIAAHHKLLQRFKEIVAERKAAAAAAAQQQQLLDADGESVAALGGGPNDGRPQRHRLLGPAAPSAKGGGAKKGSKKAAAAADAAAAEAAEAKARAAAAEESAASAAVLRGLAAPPAVAFLSHALDHPQDLIRLVNGFLVGLVAEACGYFVSVASDDLLAAVEESAAEDAKALTMPLETTSDASNCDGEKKAARESQQHQQQQQKQPPPPPPSAAAVRKALAALVPLASLHSIGYYMDALEALGARLSSREGLVDGLTERDLGGGVVGAGVGVSGAVGAVGSSLSMGAPMSAAASPSNASVSVSVSATPAFAPLGAHPNSANSPSVNPLAGTFSGGIVADVEEGPSSAAAVAAQWWGGLVLRRPQVAMPPDADDASGAPNANVNGDGDEKTSNNDGDGAPPSAAAAIARRRRSVAMSPRGAAMATTTAATSAPAAGPLCPPPTARESALVGMLTAGLLDWRPVVVKPSELSSLSATATDAALTSGAATDDADGLVGGRGGGGGGPSVVVAVRPHKPFLTNAHRLQYAAITRLLGAQSEAVAVAGAAAACCAAAEQQQQQQQHHGAAVSAPLTAATLYSKTLLHLQQQQHTTVWGGGGGGAPSSSPQHVSLMHSQAATPVPSGLGMGLLAGGRSLAGTPQPQSPPPFSDALSVGGGKSRSGGAAAEDVERLISKVQSAIVAQSAEAARVAEVYKRARHRNRLRQRQQQQQQSSRLSRGGGGGLSPASRGFGALTSRGATANDDDDDAYAYANRGGGGGMATRNSLGANSRSDDSFAALQRNTTRVFRGGGGGGGGGNKRGTFGSIVDAMGGDDYEDDEYGDDFVGGPDGDVFGGYRRRSTRHRHASSSSGGDAMYGASIGGYGGYKNTKRMGGNGGGPKRRRRGRSLSDTQVGHAYDSGGSYSSDASGGYGGGGRQGGAGGAGRPSANAHSQSKKPKEKPNRSTAAATAPPRWNTSLGSVAATSTGGGAIPMAVAASQQQRPLHDNGLDEGGNASEGPLTAFQRRMQYHAQMVLMGAGGEGRGKEKEKERRRRRRRRRRSDGHIAAYATDSSSHTDEGAAGSGEAEEQSSADSASGGEDAQKRHRGKKKRRGGGKGRRRVLYRDYFGYRVYANPSDDPRKNPNLGLNLDPSHGHAVGDGGAGEGYRRGGHDRVHHHGHGTHNALPHSPSSSSSFVSNDGDEGFLGGDDGHHHHQPSNANYAHQQQPPSAAAYDRLQHRHAALAAEMRLLAARQQRMSEYARRVAEENARLRRALGLAEGEGLSSPHHHSSSTAQSPRHAHNGAANSNESPRGAQQYYNVDGRREGVDGTTSNITSARSHAYGKYSGAALFGQSGQRPQQQQQGGQGGGPQSVAIVSGGGAFFSRSAPTRAEADAAAAVLSSFNSPLAVGARGALVGGGGVLLPPIRSPLQSQQRGGADANVAPTSPSAQAHPHGSAASAAAIAVGSGAAAALSPLHRFLAFSAASPVHRSGALPSANGVTPPQPSANNGGGEGTADSDDDDAAYAYVDINAFASSPAIATSSSAANGNAASAGLPSPSRGAHHRLAPLAVASTVNGGERPLALAPLQTSPAATPTPLAAALVGTVPLLPLGSALSPAHRAALEAQRQRMAAASTMGLAFPPPPLQ